ncbi:MAG: deoxynucleoside kinase [Oscillospiraceae bacterium]|nr:deoxynucleoside kinase [Oscillospiraceae bacterium]
MNTTTRKLIVIEGLDGSGKATQAKLLSDCLKEKGLKVREVSFPDYDSPSSSLIKMYLGGEFGDRPSDVNAYAASSFYAVDRYASFKKNWEKDWNDGIIIADRYTTSNAIHQCSKLPVSLWDTYLEWLFEYEYRLLGIPTPSAVIYLRVDPEVSQRLLKARYAGEDKRDIHEKDKEYLMQCRKAAEYCAGKFGWKTVRCDENGEMRSIDDIRREVLSLTEACLAGAENSEG